MIIFATACVECNPNSERHHHHRAAFGTYLVTLRFFRCEKQIIDCDCVSLVSCLIPAAAASVRLNLPLLSGLSAVFFLSFFRLLVESRRYQFIYITAFYWVSLNVFAVDLCRRTVCRLDESLSAAR